MKKREINIQTGEETVTDLTAEEVSAKEAREDAQTALEANKASGKAKLKAGEALNDAELSALFGD